MTSLGEILSIQNEDEFSAMFEGTSLMRAGRESLVRNVCVAAGNIGRIDLTARLRNLARNDSSPIVREHAAWALEKLNVRR